MAGLGCAEPACCCAGVFPAGLLASGGLHAVTPGAAAAGEGCLTAFFMQRGAAALASPVLSASAAAAASLACFCSPSELGDDGRPTVQLLWQLIALVRLRVLGQLRTGPWWPCSCLVGLSTTGESGPALPLPLPLTSRLQLVMALLPQRLSMPPLLPLVVVDS